MIKLPVGGALPGFAQLAVSTYHAATASSHSTISKVIMQVEERGSNPLPPVGESPSTVPSTKGSLSQKSWVHFLTCYEILGMYSNLEPRCFISPVVSKKRGINASVQRLSRVNRPRNMVISSGKGRVDLLFLEPVTSIHCQEGFTRKHCHGG